MLQLGGEHNLERIFMHLIQPDIVVFHIRLQHHALIDLVLPEGKDQDTISKSTIDIYQVVHLKLLACLLLLCSVEATLDKKSSPLREVLGVLVLE